MAQENASGAQCQVLCQSHPCPARCTPCCTGQRLLLSRFVPSRAMPVTYCLQNMHSRNLLPQTRYQTCHRRMAPVTCHTGTIWFAVTQGSTNCINGFTSVSYHVHDTVLLEVVPNVSTTRQIRVISIDLSHAASVLRDRLTNVDGSSKEARKGGVGFVSLSLSTLGWRTLCQLNQYAHVAVSVKAIPQALHTVVRYAKRV